MTGHCPVCRTALLGVIVSCPRCETPHHQDCWNYARVCAIYACSPMIVINNESARIFASEHENFKKDYIALRNKMIPIARAFAGIILLPLCIEFLPIIFSLCLVPAALIGMMRFYMRLFSQDEEKRIKRSCEWLGYDRDNKKR